MGQAKRRGTFEERQREAIARNAQLEKAISDAPKPLKQYAQRHGIQGLSNMIIMAGMVSLPPTK